MEDKKYRVKILPLFEDDLDNAVDYISKKLKNPMRRLGSLTAFRVQSKRGHYRLNRLNHFIQLKKGDIPIIVFM